MARGRTKMTPMLAPRAGEPGAVPALDPLTTLIRAAVRAEFETLRAELVADFAGSSETRAPERLTVAEAARELRCSERQVRRLLATGRLRATRLATGGSSRVLIPRAALDRLLAEGATV